MAKVFPDLAGGYSGKVGKSLYYRVKKDCFVKTLPEKTTPPTERQSEQQLLFEMMGQLSGAMAEVSQHGFPKCAKKLWTAPNMFIHVNKGLCTVESTETGAVSVDYPNMLCAKGNLMMPEVSVTYSEEEHSLSFLASGTDENYNRCKPDDVLYAAVLESDLFQCKIVRIGTRGEGGTSSTTLHSLWNKDALHVYAFATSAKGKDASRSVYLPIA